MMSFRHLPSARAWEWARAVLLSGTLTWTTLCLGGYLPGTKVVTTILVATLLVVHLVEPTRRRPHPAGWLVLPFLVYAAWNVIVITPVPWLGWLDWCGWAEAVAVFWVVLNGVRSQGPRRLIFWTLASLGVAASAFACYQHFANPAWLMLHRVQALQFRDRASGFFGIPNSLAALMLLLIPPLGALAIERREHLPLRMVCIAALAALGTGFILAVSRGAWIALAAALAIKPFFDSGRSLGLRITRAVILGVGVVAIAGSLYALSPVMRGRIDTMIHDSGERTRPIMWRGAWNIFTDHPWLGGGAGSFDHLFERYRPESYQDQPVWAHNDYLNTLADYGLIGFCLIFGAVAVTVVRCRSASGLAAAIAVGLLAFAFHLFVEFHLKIPALAMVFATLAGRVVAEAWSTGAPEPVPPPFAPPERHGWDWLWLASLVGVVAVVAATAGWIVPRFRAEEFRLAARERIDHLAYAGTDTSKERVVLGAVRADLARAVVLDPLDAQAWSDRSYADSLWALVEPGQTALLGREAAEDAARALALSDVPVEFWLRRGTGLDMEGRWVEGGNCFVEALNRAPARADVWYYDAYHFSLSPATRDAALAATAYCLRLDPGYRLAQALQQRLAAATDHGN